MARAAFAAACAASFLLDPRPAPPARLRPALPLRKSGDAAVRSPPPAGRPAARDRGLQPFLQGRFVVLRERRLGARAPRFRDDLGELPLDERPRGIEPTIQVDRGNQRFVAVRDRASLRRPPVFSSPRPRIRYAPRSIRSPSRARSRRHDRGLELRLRPSLCCGNSRNSMSAITKPRIESPRNSIDSLSKTRRSRPRGRATDA